MRYRHLRQFITKYFKVLHSLDSCVFILICFSRVYFFLFIFFIGVSEECGVFNGIRYLFIYFILFFSLFFVIQKEQHKRQNKSRRENIETHHLVACRQRTRIFRVITIWLLFVAKTFAEIYILDKKILSVRLFFSFIFSFKLCSSICSCFVCQINN